MKVTLAVLLLIIATVFSYQNCAPEVPFPKNQSSFGEDDFAYKVQLDRFAFMSCNEMNTPFNKSLYFTFRVSAEEDLKAGLGLRPEFISSLKGTEPETVKKRLLFEINSKLHIQSAIRSMEDPTSGNTFGIPSKDPEYDNFFGPLDKEPYLSEMSTRVTGGFKAFDNFSSSLHFEHGNPNEFKNLTNTLTNKFGFLGITFSDGETLEAKNFGTRVFGRGYVLNFLCMDKDKCHSQALSGVSEIDLENEGSPTLDSWDCPAQYQFRIVRFGESGNCNNYLKDSANSSFQLIKSVLGAGWEIDYSGKCIRPILESAGSCYGSKGDQFGVSYDSLNCGATGQPSCVKHLSVCIKD